MKKYDFFHSKHRGSLGIFIAVAVIGFLTILVFVYAGTFVGDRQGANSTGAMIYNNGGSSYSGGLGTNPVSVPSGPCSQKIVQIAKNEIGAYETSNNEGPRNSPTGHGITDDYKNRGWRGEPWCALFATWVLKQAGDSIPAMAGAIGVYSYYLGKGQGFSSQSVIIGTNTPQPGDIFVKKRIGGNHVGIVTSYSNGIVYTVEGNSSDKVRAGTQLLSNITGFGRPTCQ